MGAGSDGMALDAFGNWELKTSEMNKLIPEVQLAPDRTDGDAARAVGRAVGRVVARDIGRQIGREIVYNSRQELREAARREVREIIGSMTPAKRAMALGTADYARGVKKKRHEGG